MGDSLSYDSPTLVLEAGRRAVITVRNVSGIDHDFSIAAMPARDVVVRNESGHSHDDNARIVGHPRRQGEVTIQFTPTVPGTYKFYCSVTGHQEAGMTGTIVVL
jgi:uncharacterized cupredoxin-like copper-binding protein